MKLKLLTLTLSVLAMATAAAQDSYLNPVIPGCYPVPSICQGQGKGGFPIL